jgi:hypothetical protein
MQVVPFSYSFQSERLPVPQGTQSLEPGQYQGIHITCTHQSLDFLLSTIQTWFDEWDEVILVESGLSSKLCQGFIVLEWEECYIDRLFLQILQSEDSVIDFTVYIRDEEV